jgi:hypothetical protein
MRIVTRVGARRAMLVSVDISMLLLRLKRALPSAGLWNGTNDEMLAKLAKLPLETQPGTHFRYGLQQEAAHPPTRSLMSARS